MRRQSPVDDDRGAGVAVVRAVRREDLVAPGVQARHPDRVLVRVGAAVGEEHLVEARRRVVDDAPGGLAAGEVHGRRRDGGEQLGLLADRLHDGRMLVADVDVHELAREVEVLASGVVPDAASAAAGDHQRRQLRLRRPGVEHVVAVELAGEFVEVLGEVLGHGFDAFRSCATSVAVARRRIADEAGRDAPAPRLLTASALVAALLEGDVDGLPALAGEVEVLALELVERLLDPVVRPGGGGRLLGDEVRAGLVRRPRGRPSRSCRTRPRR